jgi:hypothetical protein
MKLSYPLTLAAIAGILTYQLMLPPVVGLADQGDYARLLGAFHIGPVAQTPEERYYRYFNRTYKHDPAFKLPGWEIYSTQDIFVASAVALNKWISKDGLFDIRVLSFLEMLAFMAVCYFLLRATRPWLPGRLHMLISFALILIFCDVGYISYFNSFYSEPATYISLLALVAAWIAFIANECCHPRYIALLGLCGIFFVASKPQNVAAGVILALYIVRFRALIRPHWMAPLTSAIVLAASLAVYWSVPRLARLAEMYNMVFMEMLPRSSDPAAELRSLGLNPSFAKYSGSGAFAPSTGFWNPEFQDQLDSHVSRFTILWYYVRQPGRLLSYVRAVLPRGTSLRAEGVGNFEKSAGYPPFARSRSFAIWNRFREQVFSRWASGLLIGLMLGVPLAGWISFSLRELRSRLLAECFAVLALMAVAIFFTTVLGDAHDIVKHLHLYNVLTDICLVFVAGAGISTNRMLEKAWRPFRTQPRMANAT